MDKYKTHQNTPDLDNRIDKLTMDIENLNIKDLSSMWTILSGKYLPKRGDTIIGKVEALYKNIEIFEFDYFKPILSFSVREDASILWELIEILSNHLLNLNIAPEYVFDYLIQKIISSIIRHKIGEYYTPPFLVKRMVHKVYSFGDKVLDPCCGSGNFLVEILRYINSVAC